MADGLRKMNKQQKRAAKGGLLRRAVKWMLGLGLAAGLLGAIALFVIYQQMELPDPNREFQAETTTVYYAGGKKEIGTFSLQNRDAVALSDVPEHTQQAVVSAENRSFWTDPGIDLKGIARAAFTNVRSDTTQGASTITQQYVKILYLTQERTYTRKVKEAFLALKVDREVSKSEILQGYLNTIYFGRGAYGIEAASEAYFGKSSAKLTVGESAVLASVLNSPSNFDPAVDKDNRERLLSRYRYVLSGMVSAGDLDAERAEKLSRQLPKMVKPEEANRLAGQRGFLLSLVERRLRNQGFSEDEIYGGGLNVITTFQPKAQRSLVRGVREERPRETAKGVHIGAASVEPGTGALRAMYGGPNYVKNQRNWALTGRQPGSSFKPFTLAAGLEQGHTLYDTFDGNEIEVSGGRTVNNEFDQNYGPISLEHATKISSNTAYVDLTQQLENKGKDVIDSAVRAGIPANAPGLNPVEVSTLGVADVSPVDMANGYATFAAQGQRNDWYVIQRVVDDDGERLYRHKQQPKRAYSKRIANSVNYALQQVVEDPEGTGTEAQRLGRPVAGKTGTAALRPDTVTSAWFVGYTPQLSTSVMYVRGKNGTADLDGVAGMPTFFGSAYPARTWTTAMEGAMDGKPEQDFIEPADDELIEEPYTPPPSPTYTPEPEPSPTPEPEPSPSPTETETEQPSPSPSPTETEEPSPTPTDTEEPTDDPCTPPLCGDDDDGGGGNGGGGGGNGGTGDP